MANNQYNEKLEGANDPMYGTKPMHLSHFMNQPGKAQGVGRNQAWGDALPELMNQGGDTKHPECHPEGRHKKPPGLGNMMGQ